MTYQRNETPEPLASDPVEVGYKTHLAQYNCGRRPARGWLFTFDESKVTCGRCLRAIKRKNLEELHKVALESQHWSVF